jgi:hypothetical protein
MKRLVGLAFALCLGVLLLAPSAWKARAAEKEAKGDTVLFVVTPNKVLGNPHLALKAGKYTEIEAVAVQPEAGALDVSAIKLKGVNLAKGKYTAEQCKLSGKDSKPIILEIYFVQKVPEKTKLTNIKYKGEAVATYKQLFGVVKDKPLYVFEATVTKNK